MSSLNQEIVRNIPLYLPPLPTQKRIAEILGALDDKIEVNRRINRTLENMAQALYRHWFVDFGPFQEGKFVESELGEIPEGWEVLPLDGVADFLNGLALQKFPPSDSEYLPVIKIAEMRSGITERSDKASPNINSKYIIQDGDVLFSWSGSLLLDFWCHGPGALNQHLFKVTSNRFPKWLYYFSVKRHLEGFQRIAASKATTMGHIQRHHLSEAFVPIPPDQVLNMASEKFAPIVDLIIKNRIENRTLTQTRDYLLPKLMSGELLV